MNSELKKKRMRQESKNERFWRLLRRTDKRLCGYPNLAFGWEIDQARGSGIFRHDKNINTKLPTQFLETTMRSEKMVKTRHEFREEFDKFYDVLYAVINGSIKINEIPESFNDFFKDRKLSMTSWFIKEYLRSNGDI